MIMFNYLLSVNPEHQKFEIVFKKVTVLNWSLNACQLLLSFAPNSGLNHSSLGGSHQMLESQYSKWHLQFGFRDLLDETALETIHMEE